MPRVHAVIHTDPACPWSWAAEPALRSLQVQFAAEVEFTYVLRRAPGERGDVAAALPRAAAGRFSAP